MVAVTNFIWNPVGGAVSDRIGRKPVLLTIAGLSLLTAYPALHWLMAAPTFGKMLAVEMMFSFYFGVYSGTMLGALVEIVPAHVRTTCFSLAFALAAGLFGTFTPFASTWLIDHDRRQGLARLLADVRRRAAASSRPSTVYRGGRTIASTRRRPRLASDARAGQRSGRPGFDFHANKITSTRMVDLTHKFDVLVIGGGNAALCAAISARRAGASVLVLEGAPKFYRGGNTRHTRNMRCAHDAATDILTGPYTEEEFWEDLLRVTGGQTDEELARYMIRESKDILGWIVEQGVRWQPSLGGTLSLGRTNSFFLGGGRAMLNALYLTAERLGIDILYDAEVTELEIEDGMFLSATLKQPADGAVRSPRRDAGRRRRRLRGQHRMAQGILGRGRRQFPDPRHALQPRLDPQDAAGQGRAGCRRSHPMPRGRDRRPRAEIRWRHHHPA